jgi:hypothetical protein
MEAIVVIYVPARTDQEEKDFLDTNVTKCRLNHPNLDFLYIEDPARDKAEVEVHWKPETK